MDKITLIATFVKEVTRNNDLEHSKQLVIQDFHKYLPNENLNLWNTELPEHISKHFLNNLNGVSEVDVENFIDDLTFDS